MREQIETRLTELRTEHDRGQNQLRQLDSQAAAVRETLLRISGAIMVLEELLRSNASGAEEARLADLQNSKKSTAAA